MALLLAVAVLAGPSVHALPVPVNLPPPTLETVVDLPAESSDLVSDGAGHLWGVSRAAYDGSAVLSYGTIFKVDERTRAVTTVVSLTGNGGAAPGLIETPVRMTFVPGSSGAGELWGVGHSVYDTAAGAGAGFMVFCVNAATGQFTRLKADTGTSGAFPYSNPTEPLLFVPAANGASGAGFVWGTTRNGGADDDGFLFRVATTGARDTTKVAEFKLATGHIAGELAADANGVVWVGTVEAGDLATDSFYFTASAAAPGLKQVYAFSADQLTAEIQAASLRFVPEGANGKFWAISFSAIYHIDATTKQLATVAENQSNDDGAVLVPLTDPAGSGVMSLWGVWAGLLFRITGETYEEVGDLAPPGRLSGLLPGPGGNLYASGHFDDPTVTDALDLIRFGPTPVTLPAEVAGTGAILHATVNPQGLSTTAHFEYGPDPALATFTSSAPMDLLDGTDPVDLDLTLSGLSPNAAYYFRVVAENAANAEPQSGAIVGFSTSQPLVTTGGVAGLVTGQVVLSGTANPQGAPSTAFFEYGEDTDYGSSTPPVDVGNGTTTADFTAPLFDLTPHATFHYRAVVANATFTAVGDDAMFTLPNHLPTARDLSLTTAGGDVSFDVAAVVEDADGDAVTVQVTQGSAGAVTVNGSTVTYTPGPNFDISGADHFTYTVDDGASGTATGNIGIFSRPVLTATDFGSRTDGKLLPGAGSGNVPAGAMARGFGPPSLNRNGDIAYRVAFVDAAGKTGQAILGPNGNSQGVLAITGVDLRPQGLPGLTMKSMREPVLGGADAGDYGRIAFLATLQGAGVSPANSRALFTNATADGSLLLIARLGSVPRGFERAAVAALLSIVMDGGSNLYYTLKLKAPPGTDLALAGSEGPILRTGDSLADFDGSDRKVLAIAALTGAPGTAGAAVGYAQTTGSSVLARVKLAHVGNAIVAADGSGAQVLTQAGAVPDFPETDNAVYENFSLPVGPLAPTFLASLRILPGVKPAITTARNNLGVSANASQVLRKGDPLEPNSPIVLKGFGNPVGGEGNGLAMLATIGGQGVTPMDNRLLLWQSADGTNHSLARPGPNTPAPGVPGLLLKSITTIALPGPGEAGPAYGPIFQGKLGGAGISAANDDALWATNSACAVQLVVREGGSLDSGDAAHTMKQVKSFVGLRTIAGSPAQGRAYSSEGRLALVVQFADNSQAIVRVQVP